MAHKNDNKFLHKDTGSEGWFGLGRSIDFSDYVTRIALVAMVVAAALGTGYQATLGKGVEEAAYFGMNMGLQFLAAWLLALELDPDRKLGGIIGGGISIAMGFIFGVGDVTALLWLLFIVRMLSRTAGARHQMGDNVLILAISYFLCREGWWLYPTMAGVAYVIESQIKDGYFRSLYIGGFAFALVMFAGPKPTDVALNINYIYAMLAAFVLFLPAISMASITKAKGDKDGKPISHIRLQIAQGTFLIINFMLAWFHGNDIALAMSPAWAAAMGVGIYLFALAIQRAINKK